MDRIILANLITNDQYSRAVLPFLKKEYFHDNSDQILFGHITGFIEKYNTLPTKEALYVELSGNKEINENTFESVKKVISQLPEVSDRENVKWLMDQTEEFCRDKAIHNAIHKAIRIYDKKDGLGKIPEILQEAISVSFDSKIGHDFLGDAEARYALYHRVDRKIDFHLDIFNKITYGGFSPKTLNIIIAPPHAGKTLVMCNMAAHNLLCNKNVLYISLEMAEEEISKRIDQNLLDVSQEQLENMSEKEFIKKISRLQETTKGRLMIKEYPPSSAHAGHFRNLLEELKRKQKFVPDIIYIDYVNICTSSRLKLGADSYGYVKAIAEELRAIAVDYEVPVVSATQTNRSGIDTSDFDMKNTSESVGLPQLSDFMIALIVTEELTELNQIMFKQLKNRYRDYNYYKRFVVGVDRAKMRLYNLEDQAQGDIVDDKPVMDKGKFMDEENQRMDRNIFKGFR